MARPSRPWFRFYTEAFSDRKLRRLTPGQRWLWAAVLGAARESPTPGVLFDGVDGQPMTAADLADYAGMTRREVTRTMTAFEQAEMLDRHDSGAWRVVNWRRRQFETDNVTARTQKHRAREPDRNVPNLFPGTPDNGSQERSPSRALATETENRDPSRRLADSRPAGGDPDDDRDTEPDKPDPEIDQQRRDQGKLNRLIDAALAILVDRDLYGRQQNTQLTPIADPAAWKRKATRQRIDRGTPKALIELARLDPQAGPEQLADALEPPRNGAPPSASHPLDGQQHAMLDQAAGGLDHMQSILHEDPPDPAQIERVHDAIAGLRDGLRLPGANP